MNTKTNITQYSDSELSLLFNNEQALYNEYQHAIRKGDFSLIKELANELFIYNESQLIELEADFDSEVLDSLKKNNI